MNAPISILLEAVERGLKLGVSPADTLSVEPAGLCPPEFAVTLKAHELALLLLLQLPFSMVFKEKLQKTFLVCLVCQDEASATNYAVLLSEAYQRGYKAGYRDGRKLGVGNRKP